MKGPGSGRFLYRLLGSFLAVGVIPLVALSVSFGTVSRGILQRSLVEAAESAIALAAANANALSEELASTAAMLATDPAVLNFLEVPEGERDPGLDSDLRRRVFDVARKDGVDVYVIPGSGLPAGTAEPPTVYREAAYASWGIRGSAARAPLSVVSFAQPHAGEGQSVPFAVAATARAPGGRVLGLVVLDLRRTELLVALRRAGASFSELTLKDGSGCIAFDLNRQYLEGTFADGPELPARGSAASAAGARFDSDGRRIIAAAPTADGFALQGTRPIDPLESQSKRINATAVMAGIFSAAAAVILAILLSRSIFKPVQRLSVAMGKVEAGDLSARSGISRNDELGTLAESFDSMVARIQRLMAETIEQHRLLRAAEAKALKARIDPHFLYNTLNSVRSIARLRGVEEIVVVATNLGRLLRAGFATEGEFCTLEESLGLVRSYLDIESVRYPGRFTFQVSVDPRDLAVILPRLALQPIVENAVVHGLENRVGKGSLLLSTRRSGEDILITVEDDGAGMSLRRLEQVRSALAAAETLEVGTPRDGDASPGTGVDAVGLATGTTTPGTADDQDAASAGIALVNVHRRLRLYYGAPYGLTVRSRPEGGTRVELRAPLRHEGGAGC